MSEYDFDLNDFQDEIDADFGLSKVTVGRGRADKNNLNSTIDRAVLQILDNQSQRDPDIDTADYNPNEPLLANADTDTYPIHDPRNPAAGLYDLSPELSRTEKFKISAEDVRTRLIQIRVQALEFMKSNPDIVPSGSTIAIFGTDQRLLFARDVKNNDRSRRVRTFELKKVGKEKLPETNVGIILDTDANGADLGSLLAAAQNTESVIIFTDRADVSRQLAGYQVEKLPMNTPADADFPINAYRVIKSP